MRRRPIRLDPRRFNEEITNTPYALVYLDGTPMPRFHAGVAEFFQGAYPKLFTCGVVAASARERTLSGRRPHAE